MHISIDWSIVFFKFMLLVYSNVYIYITWGELNGAEPFICLVFTKTVFNSENLNEGTRLIKNLLGYGDKTLHEVYPMQFNRLLLIQFQTPSSSTLVIKFRDGAMINTRAFCIELR